MTQPQLYSTLNRLDGGDASIGKEWGISTHAHTAHCVHWTLMMDGLMMDVPPLSESNWTTVSRKKKNITNVCRRKKKGVDINTRLKMAAALLHKATNHMIPVFPKRFPHEEEERILSGVKISALTTTGKQNDLYLLPLVSERYFGPQPNRKTVNFPETKVRLVSL